RPPAAPANVTVAVSPETVVIAVTGGPPGVIVNVEALADEVSAQVNAKSAPASSARVRATGSRRQLGALILTSQLYESPANHGNPRTGRCWGGASSPPRQALRDRPLPPVERTPARRLSALTDEQRSQRPAGDSWPALTLFSLPPQIGSSCFDGEPHRRT